MTDINQAEQYAAPAQIRKKSGIPLVWIVPLVALVIGGWLVFKAYSEKGPVISISFPSADGLEAGKTKIKFKDVIVGQVTEIRLGDDLQHVVVTADLSKDFERFLNDKTRFWITRAQIRGGTASGLDTLLSGAFIGVDPALGGAQTKDFTGLEVPPVVTTGLPGRHFWLRSMQRGSLSIGMPVYYRQIQVGQVVSFGFAPDGQAIDVQIFIEAPHHAKVTQNTRFWNASGVDVSLSAEGLKVDTQSLISIVSGALAFDVPEGAEPGGDVDEDHVFSLYQDFDSIHEQLYTVRKNWLIYFDQSVRGLSIGAPVEVYGIKIGEVAKIDLIYDTTRKEMRVPVIVSIEPERIANILTAVPNLESMKGEPVLKWFVEERNMKAQLKSGNLLTGQMLVDLGFYPQEPKAVMGYENGFAVIPSVPGSLDQIQDSIAKITRNLEKVPLEKIGNNLDSLLKETTGAIREITVAVKEAGGFARSLTSETSPLLQSNLIALQKTLEELQKTLGQDSALNYNAKKTLEELTLTLRAMRELSGAIDRHPQSFLFGKGDDKDDTKK
ncbi:intermembrane transport protein PqiB [Desulfomicrobium baculatum]|uniref:Mammalian cell entry related domain protein n=1 Tax=Desulfomicrobium baculatum (strain DSM 4028 / VKM B-1378 / X) TaxID=525897 RepID=C7LVB3_DESBD|nr:MlaD family protein [Desulfomicrobium baculatum]ACU88455.1 Mammalian cell entry related domain protein [Desulfomicrobium baculatum DSM 4028]